MGARTGAQRSAVHLRHARLRQRKVIGAAGGQQNEEAADVAQLCAPRVLARSQGVRERRRQVRLQALQRSLGQRRRGLAQRRGGLRGRHCYDGTALAGRAARSLVAKQAPHGVRGDAGARRSLSHQPPQLRQRLAEARVLPPPARRVAVAQVHLRQRAAVHRNVQRQWRLARSRPRGLQRQHGVRAAGCGAGGGARLRLAAALQRPGDDERVAGKLEDVAAVRVNHRGHGAEDCRGRLCQCWPAAICVGHARLLRTRQVAQAPCSKRVCIQAVLCRSRNKAREHQAGRDIQAAGTHSALYPDTSAKSSTAGMGAQHGGCGGHALAAERATRRGT